MNVPEIVPTEYRQANVALVNPKVFQVLTTPISGSRRYVVGDRFHASTDPLKSPLCAYHDNKLCEKKVRLKPVTKKAKIIGKISFI